MALSEEQQGALADHAEAMVARMTALTRRHHALADDSTGLQLRPPVSRHAGTATPVRHPASKGIKVLYHRRDLVDAKLPDNRHAVD